MWLAICIITFRRPAGLARLLDGLRAIERPEGAEVSVVVVDNDPEGSAAAVADAARVVSSWPLRYLRETRRGVSFARNAALTAASDADFIAFIDDDEVPGATWLVELVACQRSSGVAAVCGQQCRSLGKARLLGSKLLSSSATCSPGRTGR